MACSQPPESFSARLRCAQGSTAAHFRLARLLLSAKRTWCSGVGSMLVWLGRQLCCYMLLHPWLALLMAWLRQPSMQLPLEVYAMLGASSLLVNGRGAAA